MKYNICNRNWSIVCFCTKNATRSSVELCKTKERQKRGTRKGESRMQPALLESSSYSILEDKTFRTQTIFCLDVIAIRIHRNIAENIQEMITRC